MEAKSGYSMGGLRLRAGGPAQRCAIDTSDSDSQRPLRSCCSIGRRGHSWEERDLVNAVFGKVLRCLVVAMVKWKNAVRLGIVAAMLGTLGAAAGR